jgi:uracil-DNA glycosylase
VKCPVSDPSLAGGECIERIVEELAIVQPKMIVVMGEPALETLNEVDVPLSRTLDDVPGHIQELTPTIDALYVPDIDESLDSEESKREFWAAFRALGDWYAELPPY